MNNKLGKSKVVIIVSVVAVLVCAAGRILYHKIKGVRF